MGSCVGNASCKKDLILIVLKSVGKREVVPSWKFFNTIIICHHFSIIFNIFTCRGPVVSLFSTARIRSESSLIEGVSFSETENIKFDLHFSSIFNWKVVPLHVAIGVCVKTHVEIVLFCRNPQLHLYVPSKRMLSFHFRIYCRIITVFLLCVSPIFTPTLHLLTTWKSHQKYEAAFLGI